MKEQYKFSIVTAVYNVEAFLAEMIDSVVNQTIGLEHIQLILVNDGSTDGSGAICDRYAKEYPDNIVVIHKENGGVSTARNEGLKHVRGELVNFLDSDDKLSENTLADVYDFYQQHRDETDLIAIPLYFFDGQTGNHILNYKFSQGTRLVDLDAEWENPQLSLSSAFVRWEAFQGLEFDHRLKYAEDAQLVQMVLSHKHTIGMVASGRYEYRRRSEGEQSALQTSTQNKNWYNDMLKYFSMEVIQYYLKDHGYVPKFVQNTIMYDLQWKLKIPYLPDNLLTVEEKKEYMSLMQQILSYIDDDVIQAQKSLFREQKIHAIRLKNGKLVLSELESDVGILSTGRVINKMSSFPTRLEFVRFEDNECILDGSICFFYGGQEPYDVVAVCNGREYSGQAYRKKTQSMSLGSVAYRQDVFQIRLPLGEERQDICFYLRYQGKMIRLINLLAGTFFPICRDYENSYCVQGRWIMQMDNAALYLYPYDRAMVRQKERNFRKELWASNGVGERKAVLSRIAVSILKKIKRRPIWLLSDRASKAGDNGEALFRFLREKHKKVNAYFVINRHCDDYQRMSKVGKVLVKDSFKHKLLLLLSDYIISSHAEIEIYNPFNGYSNPYRDLLGRTKFIFLQHGVTKDDVSDWLNKYNKNLYGFITAANPEYGSIVDPKSKYFYTGNEVWLTGFPRYDRLYRDDRKQVVIMPTWRKYLMSSLNRETGVWELAPGFQQSKFYAYYDALLNSDRLIQAAKECGYAIKFFPHPNLQTALPLFHRRDEVEFLDLHTEYRDVYANSSLIITDYSSAVFDFVYLREPILYTHFDADEFFAGGHAYEKGYFDYERDGFGEVEYDLEGTVDRIIEYMRSGCQMKPEYKARVDQFFAYNDQNNCQRLYDRIMELEREQGR